MDELSFWEVYLQNTVTHLGLHNKIWPTNNSIVKYPSVLLELRFYITSLLITVIYFPFHSLFLPFPALPLGYNFFFFFCSKMQFCNLSLVNVCFLQVYAIINHITEFKQFSLIHKHPHTPKSTQNYLGLFWWGGSVIFGIPCCLFF